MVNKKKTTKNQKIPNIEIFKAMMQKSSKQTVPGMGNISGVELLKKIQEIQRQIGVKAGVKRTAGDILKERELRILNEYSRNVIQNFGRYIKAVVAFGSSPRKKTSDLDVAVLVDDTDVTRMTREELKTKLFQKLVEVAHMTDKRIHPQAYLLTEFWEYIRLGNPVLYNILRTGIPLYDTGFFLPIQMIFKQGLIKPSPETIDKHMRMAKQLLKLTEDTLKKQLVYNCEQAMVASAQAVLMEFNYRPPSPREVHSLLKKLNEEHNNIIPQELVEFSNEIVLAHKAIEHGEVKKYSATKVNEFIEKTEKFVEEMEKILKKERERKGENYKFEPIQKEEESEKLKMRREGLTGIKLPKKKDTAKESQKIIEEGLGQR